MSVVPVLVGAVIPLPARGCGLSTSFKKGFLPVICDLLESHEDRKLS
jgi:hypothetical protein